MSKLSTRVGRLEQRRPKPECPEHLTLTEARPFDIRDSLQAFSPDPVERAQYHERQDRLEGQPPCTRCGFKPFVVRVMAAETWGQMGPGDGGAA